jgi:predicted nucleotidyltransferase
MLEKILSSKAKIRILREMIETNREYTFEDITKTINMSFGTVHPILKDLADSRILIVRKMGRSKLYKINEKHLLYNKLKKMFKAEKEGFNIVAKKFARLLVKKGIKNIILFGSVARGEPTEKSDIDLLVIYKGNEALAKDNISKLSQEFLNKYDVEIVPTYLSVKEAKNRRRKFDRFIMNVLNEGKVLFGDVKWLEK